MTIDLAPHSTGYADVNGLHLYHEVYGEGSPLVLLHGGMLTIDLNFSTLIPTLARRHTVIGVELQGHGRTADIDRPITPAALAGDVTALLDHLSIDRAHIFGHSMGAATALELAVHSPGRVRSIVAASASVRPDGLHEDLTDPAKQATSTRMPTAQDFTDFKQAYTRLSPHPEHFDDFLAALSTSTADTQGWTDDQLAATSAPTLIVIGEPRLHHHRARRPHPAAHPQLPAGRPARRHPHACHPPRRPPAPDAGPLPRLSPTRPVSPSRSAILC